MNASLRQAVLNDQGRIANLIYFESRVHRHLDWRSPLDWLGEPEYWVLELDHTLAAVLACPSDPPGIAWLRLFAHNQSISTSDAWSALWQVARQRVIDTPRCQMAAAITLQHWFAELLQESGFSLTQKIIVLEHDLSSGRAFNHSRPATLIRPMRESDLPAVAALDHAAFKPIWQNSEIALRMAFSQAGLATVIEEDGQLLAYQISTTSPFGMHLARLAVLPDQQKRGLGAALVQDLLRFAAQKNSSRITVNTQADNVSSLSLYQKLGFDLTGEEYPVYSLSCAAVD